jgi:LmbE family N-acetylglucosaminyl deacetylase
MDTAPAGPPRPLLVLLAHHDDEVFCAGRIAAALRAGRRLIVVWATAGGIVPPHRRIVEGRRVAGLLELRPGDAVDLAFPDLGALDHAAQILAEVSDIAAAASCPEVLTPAFEGGHPDHDVMNLIAARLRATQPGVTCGEFNLYHAGGLFMKVADPLPLPGAGAPEWLPVRGSARCLRRALIRANSSQLPITLPLLAVAFLTGRLHREPLRALPAHDYCRPPGGRRPLYEVYTRRRFSEFVAVAQALGAV